MTVTPPVCTEHPEHAERRRRDFQLLLGKTVRTERRTAEHLRLTLSTEQGLDIAVLAEEMRCCDWFRFTLTPTAQGTVVLDIEVPRDTGAVQGEAAETVGEPTPERILDWFAAELSWISRGDD